ncbi:MAG: flagellar hook protein FlgE [Thalassobaculum sp.]|uniref:flagellar hook protein FlgE n=1 Tax=Thalassobaculum sp. TaxID=2022740 RepID=UPI0032F0979B
MSIYGGMFSGVSALAAQSQAFGIISDNIANVNTVGYKDTTARFQTLVTESIANTRYSPGGVLARPFVNPEKQGLLQGTTSQTDLALVGDGFFVVNVNDDPVNNGGDYLLTRAGSFTEDEEGNLVNNAGFFLQGWRTDSSGNIVNATTKDQLSSLETVNLAGFTSVSNPTTTANLAANLPANATTSSTQTTNLTIYDSLGIDHLLTINWTKSAAANVWDYSIDVTNNAGTNTAGIVTGTLGFDPADGTIQSIDGASPANGTLAQTTVAINGTTTAPDEFVSGADDSSIVINWGTVGQSNGMSQLSGQYEATLLNQNGSSPSTLIAVEVDNEGIVTARFENGDTRPIYKLAIGTVPASTELRSENGNAYSLSSGSGDLLLTEAGLQGAGLIESSALESSTVDLSDEFADLIITQRAYSAATRLITTGDELLSEIINVKR